MRGASNKEKLWRDVALSDVVIDKYQLVKIRPLRYAILVYSYTPYPQRYAILVYSYTAYPQRYATLVYSLAYRTIHYDTSFQV